VRLLCWLRCLGLERAGLGRVVRLSYMAPLEGFGLAFYDYTRIRILLDGVNDSG